MEFFVKHLFKSLLLIVAASTGLNVAANTSHQAIITNNSKQPIDVSIGIACRARQESSSGNGYNFCGASSSFGLSQHIASGETKNLLEEEMRTLIMNIENTSGCGGSKCAVGFSIKGPTSTIVILKANPATIPEFEVTGCEGSFVITQTK